MEYQPILLEKQDEVVKLDKQLKELAASYDKRIKQMNNTLDQNSE